MPVGATGSAGRSGAREGGMRTGLTAFIVTVHTGALGIAASIGVFAALVVVLVLRRRSASTIALAATGWWLAVAVFAYAVVCALIGVTALDVEAVGPVS
jgi:ABC-type antimicrobial peptide transport system permease subunit